MSDECMRQMIEKDFADHVAQYDHFGEKVERLEWGNKNGSSIYRIFYYLDRYGLYVGGDVGDAVYAFYNQRSFQEIAGYNLDYFQSKCVASETGRKYLEWDEEACYEAALAELKETYEDGSEFNEKLQILKDADRSSQFAWNVWLGEMGEEVFGGCWFESCPDYGQVYSIRCSYILTGIKMAVRQLWPDIKIKED